MTEEIIRNIPENDKIKSCGLDFGNGWIKLSVDGKVAKIPAAYATEQPQGRLTKTLTRGKPNAFSLVVGGRVLWFGQDILSGPVIRLIDERKYRRDHIRALFAAVCHKWQTQHKARLIDYGKLRIVAGVPPTTYEDKVKRAKAEKAYKSAFTNKSHWYVRPDADDTTKTFEIVTEFVKVTPEAASYASVKSFDTDYLVYTDAGFGTVDYVLFQKGSALPVRTRTQNNGMVHAFDGANDINAGIAELSFMRGEADSIKIVEHLNGVSNVVDRIRRQLQANHSVSYRFGGGAFALCPATYRKELQEDYRCVIPEQPEFENVRIFEALANV